MKEFYLKVFFSVGLLFVLFLWSGGLYSYSNLRENIRYNKLTGDFQVFNIQEGWHSVYEK